MRKIVCLDRATIASQIHQRKPGFAHRLIEYGYTRPEEVVARLIGAAVAIVNRTRLTAEAVQQLPDLRLIAVAATGADGIDTSNCAAQGIAVANIRG